MDDQRYILHTAPVLTVPDADAELLLALGDGDAALLYLLLLRTPGAADERELCRALNRTEEQVRAAAAKLRSAGLLGEKAPGRVLPPPDELPEYSVEDIVRRSREDPEFKSLAAEAAAKLGHLLSRADYMTLFGIYDHLGLPCEVIMLLINRCAENVRRRYGEGRLPTMRVIEREAYTWVNREIVTLERAEEYIAALDRREEEYGELMRLLQITGRQPTPSERRYMESWLDMGFSREALAEAYDRTVLGTGKLTWKYMDKILRAWHEKGLYTIENVLKGDTRAARSGSRSGRERAPVASADWHDDDLDKFESILGRKEGK